jgi:tRNA 5-methylaminomethyl-2-thiouridine biosynthesis bifunctional protein
MRSSRLTPAVIGTVAEPPGATATATHGPEARAWAQAREVFLQGNGLPERWQGRDRFTVLEAGFGLGHNFMATWSAWRRDPGRCRHLFFASIEKHPLTAGDFARVHLQIPAGEHDHALLAHALHRRWPELTPGLHLIHFEGHEAQVLAQVVAGGEQAAASGPWRVTLMLAFGDVADVLPQLMLQADAFYLDGFAPARNPERWAPELLARLNRLAAPDATVATRPAAQETRDALTQAGFAVCDAPGQGGKLDACQGTYRPRHLPEPPPGGQRRTPAIAHRTALIVGVGLAGACTALALCREGWHVTLVDQASGPAKGASGNPGGLFHSIVHGEDGVHTRAHRAAALATCRLLQWPLKPWPSDLSQLNGLLRLAPRETAQAAADLLDHLGWPASHLHWLDAAAASQRAQVPLNSGAWCFEQAGVVNPSAWVPALLQQAREWAQRTGGGLQCEWGVQVQALQQDGAQWRVDGLRGPSSFGPNWRAQAHSVVLCNAQAVNALVRSLPPHQASTELPLSAVRGQTTLISAQAQQDLVDTAGLPRPHLPTLPLAGSGYALRLPDGGLLLGATTQHHDADPTVRDVDHQHNLRQAVGLGVLPEAWGAWAQGLPDTSNHPLMGRTQWRATTPDRLPLVGALPWSATRLALNAQRRMDQVRLLPRNRDEAGGLYVVSGLGSRGITWAGLLVDLVAHWVAGTSCPVEVDLRDAMDPARFLARQHKRGH